MTEFRIRAIDPDLWEQVKARAKAEGRPLRFVLLQLLRVYAAHGFTVVETFDRKTK